MLVLPRSIITKLDLADLRKLRTDLVATVRQVEWEIERTLKANPARIWREIEALPATSQTVRWARRVRRDIDVMRLARQGHSNAEIARRHGLHPSTISTIVQRVLRDADAPITEHALYVLGGSEAIVALNACACETGRSSSGVVDVGDDESC
jgi:lambda repressor-like predicted transcriptional regulator